MAGELILDAQSAIAMLSGAARALTLVAWRPRPSPSDEESLKGATATWGTARVPDEGENSVMTLGTVPLAYYSHNVLSAPMPSSLPLYEDLTAGVWRGGSRGQSL